MSELFSSSVTLLPRLFSPPIVLHSLVTMPCFSLTMSAFLQLMPLYAARFVALDGVGGLDRLLSYFAIFLLLTGIRPSTFQAAELKSRSAPHDMRNSRFCLPQHLC
jgi:hypothetical protein